MYGGGKINLESDSILVVLAKYSRIIDRVMWVELYVVIFVIQVCRHSYLIWF